MRRADLIIGKLIPNVEIPNTTGNMTAGARPRYK